MRAAHTLPVNSRVSATLLGAFGVGIDGTRLPPSAWGHGSAERLLKLLLLTTRHRLRRDTAAELLWPEAAPGRAMANLRRAMHFLGRAVERHARGTILLRDHGMVGFAAEVVLESDVDILCAALDRIDLLLRAHVADRDESWLALLSRDTEMVLAFGGCELLPDDPYEEWVARHRDQLTLRWQSVMLLGARALSELGETAQAHAVVDRVLSMDPADEDAHCLAIELYANAGREHAARRQLLACRRILREYGIEPSPSTVALLSARPGGEEGPALRDAASRAQSIASPLKQPIA